MSRSNQLAGLLTADPPSALDTINEINTALGNDASLSTTLTNSIATKMPLAGGAFTGNITIPNGGTIGSAGDADAITIASTGKINTTSANAGTAFEIENTNGSTNYGLFIKGGTSSSNAHYALGINNSADSPIFRVMGNGNVGIGTSSPSYPLHVLRTVSAGTISSGGNLNTSFTDGNTGLGFSSTNNDAVFASFGNNKNIIFAGWNGSTNTERLRINSSGNVGIGTTSPSYKLETKDGDISAVTLGSASGGTSVNGIRFRINNSASPSQFASLGMVSAETESGWGGSLIFSTKPANGSPNESVTEAMRIDSSGRVTVPYQPAFSAYIGSATYGPATLPFSATILNRGGHFNTSTYRFTAPIAGVYFFHYHNNHQQGNANSNDPLYADWLKNGSALGRHRMYTFHSGGWEELSGSIAIELQASDYMQIRLASAHRADGGGYSCFSGHLIG